MDKSVLYRYLDGEASEAEVRVVQQWINQSQEHRDEYIALKTAMALTASDAQGQEEVWMRVEQVTRAGSKGSWWVFMYRTAAVLILAGLVGAASLWFFQQRDIQEKGVVLEMPGTTKKFLEPKDQRFIRNASGKVVAQQRDDQIVYTELPGESVPVLQKIHVPEGTSFKVVLSDGTLVHLNAGSTLEFPSSFAGPTREVLLKGEAFFEVVHKKDQPFVLKARQVEIEVLGTSFNVSAYDDEFLVKAYLVDGAVSMSQGSQQVVLSPGELGIWNPATLELNQRSGNAELYTSWRNAQLIFEDISSGELFRKLERSYGIKIENHSELLERQRYTGKFDLKQKSPEEILKLLQLDTPFSFTKSGNTFSILPNK